MEPNRPWLTIVGLGEDGLDGLSLASRSAIQDAEIIMGPPRHLGFISKTDAKVIEWPVPFSKGLAALMPYRGQNVVVLASGNPFWFGAGTVLAKEFASQEWRALPAPSTFSWVASKLGWPLEKIITLGLHAAPIERLRPHLTVGQRIILLIRSAEAATIVANYLTKQGFGDSQLWVLESLGGPHEKITASRASNYIAVASERPVCLAMAIAGTGNGMPLACGLNNHWFNNDGQITKPHIRALTLSALAPRHGDHLWDIGGGSGSIAIEWLLCHPSLRATIIEKNPERVEIIRSNAKQFGMNKLEIIHGNAPAVLSNLVRPQVVFVGGGLNKELLNWLKTNLAPGIRLVANAVTLETEALLINANTQFGGSLMRIELSHPSPIGSHLGWKSTYPITQFSLTL
ncbi:MAG: precorrin-6y C5,15-methyltransferase (decarboxylating) subunit CbiE [Aestuariivita sp.]|nr:precorrin-6y C5,15-methyltransferase (decarboxylating) subunit CbiE [Aestuariivita sp.]MCY4202673.1 precorrin-6y C5,15-methyltransferase (decarboxylating) subunit CbiE [Aestuariivita sp.]